MDNQLHSAKAGGAEIVVVVSGSNETDAAMIAQLQSAGLEMAVCKDPNHATKIIEVKPRGWQPHLFLVDVIIPGLSGFEIVRRILAAYGRLQIPVAMMSPYSAPEDVMESANAGAVALLKKPITAEMIRAVIEKHKAAKTKSA